MQLLTKAEQDGLALGMYPSTVRPGELIPVAAQHARFFLPEEVANPEILAGLQRSGMNLRSTLHKTCHVEADLLLGLKRELASIDHEITRLRHAHIGLPTLDPSFLRWKSSDGYPGFSIYGLDNPLCRIRYSTSRFSLSSLRSGSIATLPATVAVEPFIPPWMQKHYLDDLILTIFQQETQQENLSSIELTARYAGAMPASVRENIYNYRYGEKRGTFEQILIIAEAPVWERQTTTAIAIGDPLVVGIKSGLLFLIDSYDLTPVEQVVSELNSSATPRGRN